MDGERHDFEYIHISWNGMSKSGKTNRYMVSANRDSAILGEVVWSGRWRQYVFAPKDYTSYSAGCLCDVADFLADCTSGHRAR